MAVGGIRAHAIRFPEEEIVTAGKLGPNHWFVSQPLPARMLCYLLARAGIIVLLIYLDPTPIAETVLISTFFMVRGN